MLGFSLIIQDNITGNIIDISELVEKASWTTNILADQPGKLEFSFVNDELLNIGEGSPVSMKIDDIGYFYGYIMKQVYNETKTCTFTAFDQMYYLKNKNFKVFQNKKAHEIFERMPVLPLIQRLRIWTSGDSALSQGI